MAEIEGKCGQQNDIVESPESIVCFLICLCVFICLFSGSLSGSFIRSRGRIGFKAMSRETRKIDKKDEMKEMLEKSSIKGRRCEAG